jgi:ribosomal protein S18 acetylase RimI-like enzyme
MTAKAGLRLADVTDIAAVTAFQHAAYARNRAALGVEPLPLVADYADIFARHEVWIADGKDGPEGVLILQARPDDLLIWSVAAAPQSQGRGLGNRLLVAAEARALELDRGIVRLYTGEKLTSHIAWYERHGYRRERTENLGDRRLVHMIKHLARPT